ncbi:MAG: glutamate--cysteine ligase [Oleiphilaceae bacterium]|nr:glutamate--cysteine ligase [Oleiphilaceae bacterium]
MTSAPSSHAFQSGIDLLSQVVTQSGLPIKRGIEKEGLRTSPQFDIAQSDHPRALGHPLTHAQITTDYSEALLELITPVSDSRENLLTQLAQVHRYVQQHLPDELLWAGSMPCRLAGDKSIRIAEYGNSNIGRLKHVYRQGLGVRYGRIMQSIAGLHFNFSLDDAFWLSRQQALGDTQSLQDFKSDQYFALIRNFRRHSWLLMYLFGASPALDSSFLNGHTHDLEPFDDKGTFFKPYATSLRMGDLGYHNNAQSSLNICFNTLSNFTHTLSEAIHTSYAPYEKIGIQRDGEFIQLNTNILQIENEYYSSIRPKRTTRSGERPTQALRERGVEYVEVRCLDLNPFLPLGISDKQVDFLDLFLLHCLLQESPVISDDSCRMIERNFSDTVNIGRQPGLTLQRGEQSITLQDWGLELMESMAPLATTLDKATQDNRYHAALAEQGAKLRQSDLTPSAEILHVMREENLSWLEFAGELSRKHQQQLHTWGTSDASESLSQEAEASFTAAAAIESADTQDFAAFMAAYQQV